MILRYLNYIFQREFYNFAFQLYLKVFDYKRSCDLFRHILADVLLEINKLLDHI